MPTINVPATNLTAGTWFFSNDVVVPAGGYRSAALRATDPNGQWFTRTGHVKAYGVQINDPTLPGSWNNVNPWLGWSWLSYCVPLQQDVVAGVADPNSWVAFGTSVKNDGVTLPLFISVSSGNTYVQAGDHLRMAVLVDASIRLGATITLA